MANAIGDHLDLLCDVGEVAARLAGSSDAQGFLSQIVGMVATHLGADVCSIYLFEEAESTLVLRATHGLLPDSVGRIRMGLDEGLTGQALRELRPICESRASRNPLFKHFAGINEEPYDSFLAVPICKGLERIGVLAVQRGEIRAFSARDTMALRATASQLANAIENARVLMNLQALTLREISTPPQSEFPSVVRGRVASKGWAYGRAVVRDPERFRRLLVTGQFTGTYVMADFQAALDATVDQLQQLQASVKQRLPEMASLIFDAHLMMLKDPTLIGEMTAGIEGGGSPPEVVLAVGRKYIDLLAASDHAYMREKAQDVEDLVRRLMGNMIGTDHVVPAGAESNIVIARELFPSDILTLSIGRAAGAVLVSGGVTSHVSILARSLHLPLLIAEAPELLALPEGTPVLLDDETGSIFINPSEDLVASLRDRAAARRRLAVPDREVRESTVTREGTRIRLLANVNLLSDLALARDAGAEGVGLYRSEFPFLIRSSLPSEDEQVVIYTRLVQGMGDKEVTFRTLDLGGDKLLAYFGVSGEANPALGLRSIRFAFRYDDEFKQQLRAILRAGAAGAPLRIMFPMVASLEDFLRARDTVQQCIDALRGEGLACHKAPALGVMMEVPSAVEIADELARHADFLCVGTNDLIQFLLAVDRTNEHVASYFVPHHPAVLRALSRIGEAGQRYGREVSVCGEMAHEEAYVPFLLGIGARALSLDPQYLPQIQDCIESISIDQVERDARELLACQTVAQVASLLGLGD